MNGIKTLKLAAVAGMTLAATSAFGTQAYATFPKLNATNFTSTMAPITLAGSHRKTIIDGFFLTRDGSRLFNEYKMTDSNTLQARRHISSGPGPWGTFKRISSDTFRSSAGHVYTILDQNRLQFNGGRVLYRDVPIPVGSKPSSDCIEVAGGLQVCFDN